MHPGYLTIRKPDFDFVKLAAAFGVEHGRVVRRPDEVLDALREGADHVLKHKTSYVLDVRLAHWAPLSPTDPTKERALAMHADAAPGALYGAAPADAAEPPPPLDAWFRGLSAEIRYAADTVAAVTGEAPAP